MNQMNDRHVLVEFSQITDLIYLGTNLCCTDISHVQVLLNLGINAEIDLEKERQAQIPTVDVYLWLPVANHEAPTPEQFDTGVVLIDSLVKNNRKV